MDLLHYCMYADRHIAISEDEMIEEVARTMNWDPNISYEYYEGKSTGAARKALASKEARAEFMKSLHERLKDKASRTFALKVADDLMKVDGEKKQEEFDALSELKRALRVQVGSILRNSKILLGTASRFGEFASCLVTAITFAQIRRQVLHSCPSNFVPTANAAIATCRRIRARRASARSSALSALHARPA